jgi:hypothetical protein
MKKSSIFLRDGFRFVWISESRRFSGWFVWCWWTEFSVRYDLKVYTLFKIILVPQQRTEFSSQVSQWESFCERCGTETRLPSSTSIFPVYIILPILYTHLYLHVALARRTKGRNVEAFPKGGSFVNREELDRQSLPLFPPVFKMLKYYLCSSVLSCDTAENSNRRLQINVATLISSDCVLVKKYIWATLTFSLELNSFTYFSPKVFLISVAPTFLVSSSRCLFRSSQPLRLVTPSCVPSCVYSNIRFVATNSWRKELQCLGKKVFTSFLYLHAMSWRRWSGWR